LQEIANASHHWLAYIADGKWDEQVLLRRRLIP
jgi:hypothetical protein